MENNSCFKAYDIRGKLGVDLNDEIAYRIGRAFSVLLSPKKVVVGGDMRLSTESLKRAVANGLVDSGVEVVDIGLCGTEEVYFATSYLEADGGIMVTASHNPKDYNGMKLVSGCAQPISEENGLKDIQGLVKKDDFSATFAIDAGSLERLSVESAYIDHLLRFVDLDKLKPLRILVNPGNGSAGHVIDALEQRFSMQKVPVEFIKINHHPDGTFPKGIPNPLVIENRQATIEAVRQHQADLGIAWDIDFDRCYLFDERGNFVDGYYVVGLLAESVLLKDRGQTIGHDPRLRWNTLELIEHHGGRAIQCRTGHAFFKNCMRENDAVYGGEISGHHYFRDFFYCDSGMIPWLLVVELLSQKGQPLSELVAERRALFPSSGEINSRIENSTEAIARVREHYGAAALLIDDSDGISIEMSDWRFNLRESKTESLVRLNVESRGDEALMREKTQEVLDLLRAAD